MRFTRRNMILQGLRVSALVPFLPELGMAGGLSGLSGLRGRKQDRVLVVLQLTGGNDGLNTVVPFRQDDYYRLRSHIGHAKGALHRLDDDHGLHPQARGLHELFEEGRLAVVHGVGNPVPDRSHFRSLEVWHTAKPTGPVGRVGWLGRLADQISRGTEGSMPALAVEQGDLPLSMRGEVLLPPSVHDPVGFKTHPASERVASYRDALCSDAQTGDLGYLRQMARTTYSTARRMAELTESPSSVDYPYSILARQLKLVSQLVRGGFGTRIFHLSLGGFDTHSRQRPAHNGLIQTLSSSLAAFQRDLEANGVADRVVTLVFSEFGRRVEENGSKGTDHGRGAPSFLMGTQVRGGLHGTGPDLGNLVDGDVPVTTDFRSLYTLLEGDWMGLDPSSDVAAAPLLS